MNTLSFLIAFSAVLCGVFANPQVISGQYYGGNHGGYGYDHGHGHGHDHEHDHGYGLGHGHGHGHARVSAWVEPSAPCEGSSTGARVHVSTSSDYNSALRTDGGASYGGADIAPLASAPLATGSQGCSAGCAPTRTTYQQHPGFPQQNERGEIIIHRPAPIIVKRPPTKVLVNHPPLVVKPAPVVLHRPPPMVIKPVLVRHHPQPVKVEPVYVKVMKPATSERYVLDDKNNQGCGGNDGSYGNYGHSASLSAVDTGCH